MHNKQAIGTEATARRISASHGPLVAFGWWLTKILAYASVYFIWLRVARIGNLKLMAFDRIRMKPKLWWQDFGLIWWLLFGILALALVQEQNPSLVFIGGVLAGYLLLDSILYHVRVLWFDGLSPAIAGSGKKVWSNLRLVFMSILSYAWSIVLFYVVYRAITYSESTDPAELLQTSFATATTFDLSGTLGAVSNIQVVVSLFYLAVVIATIVSISYRRKEIASSNS